MKRAVSTFAVSVLACGANASVVVFTNTNPSFDLKAHDVINDEDSVGPWQALDITQDVFNQPAESTYGPSWSVQMTYEPGATSGDGNNQKFHKFTNSRVATVVSSILEGYDGFPMDVDVVENFGPGDTIGPGSDWSQPSGRVWERNPFGQWHFISDVTPTILGVQIILPDGIHYGFVEVIRYYTAPFPRYHPLSWGYETDVNVPITLVPAPCTAAMLVGAAFVKRRRR